jgi:RNA recognition motif-containing protein
MSKNKQIKKTGQQDENPADVIDFDYEKLEDLPDINLPESKNPEGEELVSTTSKSLIQQKSNEEKKDDKVSEPPADPQEEVNGRSVFVKNVHFSATTQEIEKHFADCGPISRVTILKNKMTYAPLG